MEREYIDISDLSNSEISDLINGNPIGDEALDCLTPHDLIEEEIPGSLSKNITVIFRRNDDCYFSYQYVKGFIGINEYEQNELMQVFPVTYYE